MSLAAPARPSFLLEHVRLCLKHVSATYSVCSPPPCGEGLGVGVHQRITARPPPRRFAIADAKRRRSSRLRTAAEGRLCLPTRGRVKTEFAARADSISTVSALSV